MQSEFLKKYLKQIIYLTLVGVTLLVFWRVEGYEFVHYDDDEYVMYNSQVQQGVTIKSLKWAFSTGHAANWHPLTWISHMIDYSLYGDNPRGHHLTGLLFHIINSCLLLFLLQKITHSLWRSSLVAFLFALHPLHVESVAWVAERKDVLSTLFWLLTTYTYFQYAQNKSKIKYALTVIFLALGLMTKPMLVSLPITLLLLDIWPLERLKLKDSVARKMQVARQLLWEKVPFFILVLLSSIVTFFVQQHGGAVQSIERYPLLVRTLNAMVAYVGYIWKMIWPVGLAVIYPHPGADVSPVLAGGAALFLLVITVGVLRYSIVRPYLCTGWFWYLITLVPVIGFVQVGFQAMADRYTYIPLIGLFIMLAWSLPDFERVERKTRKMVSGVLIIIMFLLMTRAWHQVGFWRDSLTLFNRAVAVTSSNYVAYEHLGVIFLRKGDFIKANQFVNESLRIKPTHYPSMNNLGYLLLRQGKTDEAIKIFQRTLSVQPKYVAAHNNLGLAYYIMGDIDNSLEQYQKALELQPEDEYLHDNIGVALLEKGEVEDAISHLQKAIDINPQYAEAHYDLGRAIYLIHRKKEAQEHIERALELKPEFAPARDFLIKIKEEEKNQ